MIKYVPFRHLQNIIPFNKKMIEIVDQVNKLTQIIESNESPSKANETDKQEMAVEVTVSVPEDPAVFDWRTSEDVAALKEYAKESFDLEIKGNKKADTVREEIREFLSLKD